jgi:hypothetical protein
MGMTPVEFAMMVREHLLDGSWTALPTVEVIGSTLLVTTNDQRFVIRIHEDKGWRPKS